MLLYLVRHAQSEGNAQVPGAPIDCGLTDLGRRQAAAVANLLAPMAVTHLLASPYVRTLETAEPIRAATSAPAEIVPLLHEHHVEPFGAEWPLMSRRAIAERFPRFVVPESFSDHAWHQPPETHAVALQRAREVLAAILRRFECETGARVVLVTHGSPAGKLIQAFMGATDADRTTVSIANASLSILEERDGRRFVHAVNRIDHLSGPASTGR
jgi:broad specificity phosphatase PhoE